jgi:hypothetical protein
VPNRFVGVPLNIMSGFEKRYDDETSCKPEVATDVKFSFDVKYLQV